MRLIPAQLAPEALRVIVLPLVPIIFKAVPLLATIPTPSPVVEESSVPELEITEWTLANGVRVVLKPTVFKDDEVLVQAFSPGGYSLSTLEEHMSASNADQMVALGGVGSFSMVDLQKRLAGKAAMVWLKKGKGKLVLMGFNPQFRASTTSNYKLLFNGILLGQ